MTRPRVVFFFVSTFLKGTKGNKTNPEIIISLQFFLFPYEQSLEVCRHIRECFHCVGETSAVCSMDHQKWSEKEACGGGGGRQEKKDWELVSRRHPTELPKLQVTFHVIQEV